MADLRQGYWVEILPVLRHDGSSALCFVAKRTFRVAEAALIVEPLPDEEQPPLQIEDRYDEGDPVTAAPTLEGDLAPQKAAADVIVVGKSFAPGGKPLPEWTAKLRIGRVIRELKLIGPRRARWTPPRKQGGELHPQLPVITPPQPIKEVVLSMSNAYGGRTRVVPDPAELDAIRVVQQTMDAEQADRKKAKQQQKEAKAEAAKKAEVEAARDAILHAPLGDVDDEEKGLRRARGEFGYDKDGVRLWGAATSTRGTAVMDLGAFEAWQQQQEAKEAAKAAAPADPTEAARRKALRRNADGELLEVDDGAEILDETKLAVEREKARQEQAEWRAQWVASAAKARREAVQSNDGTAVIDLEAMNLDGDDDLDADRAWERKLNEELAVADAERRVALKAEIEAVRKAREEKLAEFPELPCPTNPYGKGFVVSNVRDVVDGLELPLIEDPAAPLTARDLLRDPLRLDAVPLPAGWSTWPRSARPRIDKAGAYPADIASFDDVIAAQKAALDLEEDDDVMTLRELNRREKPKPMQPGFFNSAAPWMQFERIVGDEEIELDNLTKSGHLIFRLPGRAVLAELDRGNGVERQELTIDTLVLEPDKGQVSIVWRTHYPLASFDDLANLPKLTGWVLDLDVKDKRAADWAEQAARKRGDGTAIIDLAEFEAMEAGQEYWRTISDERKANEAAAAAADGTAALDIEKMGLYRQTDDTAWEAEVAGGVIDVSAQEKQAKADAELAAKQLAAVKALEEKEKADELRRKEIAEAHKDGKPIPPPDDKKTPKQLAEAQKARAEKAEKAEKAAKSGKGAAAGDGPKPPPPPPPPPAPPPPGKSAKPKPKRG